MDYEGNKWTRPKSLKRMHLFTKNLLNTYNALCTVLKKKKGLNMKLGNLYYLEGSRFNRLIQNQMEARLHCTEEYGEIDSK